MDNAQDCDTYINIVSLQTYRSYLHNILACDVQVDE
jgi:hypothetical protein